MRRTFLPSHIHGKNVFHPLPTREILTATPSGNGLVVGGNGLVVGSGILFDGGAGTSNRYQDIATYNRVVNHNGFGGEQTPATIKGKGLGKSFGNQLNNLLSNPAKGKKRKNIQFN